MTRCNRYWPYSLGPRVRGLLGGLLGLGRVYRTHNAETGAPALMEVPTGATPHRIPRAAVRLLITRWAGPRGGTAVEVQTGDAVDGIAACDAAADLIEGALARQEVAPHMRRWNSYPARLAREKARWRPRVALAVALGLLVWPGPTVNVRSGEPLALPGVGELALADAAPKVYRMPDGPIDGQDTPPCGRGFHAIRGGCWARLENKPPNCPDATVEHSGGCYMPVRGAKPVPMSITR